MFEYLIQNELVPLPTLELSKNFMKMIITKKQRKKKRNIRKETETLVSRSGNGPKIKSVELLGQNLKDPTNEMALLLVPMFNIHV